VIDEKGKIAAIYPKVKGRGHAAALLKSEYRPGGRQLPPCGTVIRAFA
jgi:hypothetical protein